MCVPVCPFPISELQQSLDPPKEDQLRKQLVRARSRWVLRRPNGHQMQFGVAWWPCSEAAVHHQSCLILIDVVSLACRLGKLCFA